MTPLFLSGLERRTPPRFSGSRSSPSSSHSIRLLVPLQTWLGGLLLHQFNAMHSRQILWLADGYVLLRLSPEPTRALSADAATMEHSKRTQLDTLHRALGHNLLFVL